MAHEFTEAIDDGYAPSPEEVAQWEEMERLQAACSHPDGIDPEDGCLICGFYAK